MPGMKRIFVLPAALALAVVVSPAAGASPPAPAHGAEAPAEKPDPSATRVTGSSNYLPTFGLRASITRGNKVRGVLAVDAGIDIPDTKTRQSAEGTKPRVMNAMRDAVLAYASLSYKVGEPPDADLLKARMQKAVDAQLGPGAGKVVLASVIVFKQ